MKYSLSNTALAISAILLAGCQSSPETTNNAASTNNAPVYQCQANNNYEVNDLRIYQVMVESFVNGDDTIGHGTGYGTSHHKGDIQGIIDSLDYIESLGMNAIWLTPIFNSEPISGQEHWADRLDATGYFATDYFSIDPRFGTLDKAKELVEQAHARGLYVFFDGVFGHHKEGKIVPSPSGKLPFGESNPVAYPESLEFYQEVASYWVKELKIDGWRLDQAYQVPKEAWTEIRQSVDDASAQVEYTNHKGETVNPLGYMVAEIWAGENRIIETGYGTNENPALCSAFDFPMRYRLTETFAVNEAGVGGKDGEWLAEGMSLHSLYPDHAKPNLMLGNHDLVRFGDLLQRGNIASPQDAEYWQRYKGAFSFQAAYTGPITTYYGDEIGDELEGFADKVWENCAIPGLCDDHVARTSAKIDKVTADLTNQERKLKQYVTELMELRQAHPALSQGKRINLLANEIAYVDHKQYQDDTVLYMVNVTEKVQTLELTQQNVGSLGTLTDLQTQQTLTASDNQYQVTLQPFQGRFLSIDKPSAKGPVAAKVEAQSETGQGFMAQCDNPTLSEAGPVSSTLYVVGNFADSGWKHKPQRAFAYKGDNTYQVVTSEKPGSYRMQYAAKSWSPQYTADGLTVKLGEENPLMKGGYGKDTAVTIRNAGKYVWSLKFDDSGAPVSIMASKCP